MGERRSRSVNDKLLERKVVARAAVMFRCIRGSSSVAGGWLPGKGPLTLHFHPGENFTGAITRDDMTLLFYLKSRARRGKSRLPVTGLCRVVQTGPALPEQQTAGIIFCVKLTKECAKPANSLQQPSWHAKC